MWKVWSMSIGLLLGAIFWFTGTLSIGFIALAAILIFAPALVFVVGFFVFILSWMRLL
jgi:hypothetical protein